MNRQTSSLRFFAIAFPIAVASFLLAVLVAAEAPAQDDFDEEDLRLGLAAELRGSEGNRVERIDERLAFRIAAGETLDERLAAGKTEAVWRGRLMSQAPGRYELHFYLQGRLQVTLAGKQVIDEAATKPRWVVSKPLEDLPFDWHRFEVRFQCDGPGQLRAFWSGPGFSLEPISPRRLYHQPGSAEVITHADGSEVQGRRWVDALRCAACHTHNGLPEPEPAPSLRRVRKQIDPAWMVDWLTATAADESHDGGERQPLRRRMPYYGMSREDALAVAAFLWNQAEPPKLPAAAASPSKQSQKQPREKKKQKAVELTAGRAAEGKRLLLTVGCLACHTFEEAGEDNLYGGSDLTAIASKRPADFFPAWLKNPALLNADHRMPLFPLSEQERRDVSVFLAACDGNAKEGESSRAAIRAAVLAAAEDAEVVRRGRSLAIEHRCAACHNIDLPAVKSVELSELSKDATSAGCAGPARDGRPHYGLPEQTSRAAAEFFHAARQNGRKKTAVSAELAMQRRNCTSCHQRDHQPGLARRLQRTIADFPELASQTPAMTPPPLISIGDKLRDGALRDAILNPDNDHRPWLLVRMPKYRLSERRAEHLVEHLITADRIPAGVHTPSAPESDASHGIVGARLVTPDGFGCTSCHRVGSVKPPKAPLNAIGPDLAQLGKRIRYPWFQRWVRNPARIVPRMEMPSVQVPVSGVLKNDLDAQLETVWNVLNDPAFRPPAPNPVRIVRAAGDPSAIEPAHVLTDVLQTESTQYIKPLLIGLPNRHNVLLDLQRFQLAGWWLGDTTRQRTKGKTWYWEPGGPSILTEPAGDWQLIEGDRMRTPERRGQFVTEMDRWRHTAEGGLAVEQRLVFGETTLKLRHRIESRWSVGRQPAGWSWRIEVEGLPAGGRLSIPTLASASAAKARRESKRTLRWDAGPAGQKQVTASLDIDDQGRVQLNGDGDVTLAYAASVAPDRFPPLPPFPPLAEPVKIETTPGFDSTRLPLSDEIMPTGLAWREDGTLVVTSLKGRVWLVRDSDGDGLEDQLQPFSDELAAPFGAVAEGDHIDVVNKFALLRLYDRDGDGRAEETVTLASGWGHTADYHDWTIGLPRDAEGAYWIATACQQDKRSPAAAALRGVVMKLIPPDSEADSPRYRVEPISRGHRFPIGIARNQAGRTFVTDNQGNFNPFNELNEVLAGRHYGFINAIDRQKSGERPPLTPPAVKIPHPWTRSVNGIGFLETPPAIAQREGSRFGPFEGHLIGCEYDTRRLVRVSLQEVDGWTQGAVYPFSEYHPSGGATFLGPLTCAVSPQGDLYVASIRDSGWGGANNIGSLVRMRPRLDRLPLGIAEVRAVADGFVIHFTKPVESERATATGSYSVASYRRESTPAYGGPDIDHRKENVLAATLSADRRSVRLRMGEMRAGHVYEIRVRSLAAEGERFHPAEAFYSLTRIPRREGPGSR